MPRPFLALLVTLLLLALAFPAHARLGDSAAQLDKRYKRVSVAENGTTRTYDAGAFRIVATLTAGRCTRIVYSRRDGGGIRSGDADAIMKANGAGFEEGESGITIAGGGADYGRKRDGAICLALPDTVELFLPEKAEEPKPTRDYDGL